MCLFMRVCVEREAMARYRDVSSAQLWWEGLKTVVKSEVTRMEIVLSFAYPRLDINVSWVVCVGVYRTLLSKLLIMPTQDCYVNVCVP